MDVSREFAILAPVPEEYLRDGAEVAAREGKVAFGSCAWEVFREIDRLRDGAPVETLIYASHHLPGTAPHWDATWRGLYIGHVESRGGAHPDGLRYRPPSTAKHRSDNRGHWGIFWELRDLHPLPDRERIRIATLSGHGKGRTYAPGFVPEGPLIIEYPWKP